MGHGGSQYSLAVVHANGHGVERDLVQAYMWLQLAVNQGNSQALKTRGAIGKQLTLAQLNQAEARAREWTPTTR